jgi:hypothetical protein
MTRFEWGTMGIADMGLHGCNCMGPQPGEKLCPCMLHAENERKRRMLSDGVIIDGQPYRLVPAKPKEQGGT